MIDGRNIFDYPNNSDLKKMKILEKLLLVRGMITQLVLIRLFLIQIKLKNDCNRIK